MSRTSLSIGLACLAIAGMVGNAHAGHVTYQVLSAPADIYDVSQRLIGSFKFNLRGVQRYAATETALVSPADFDPFAREWARATVSQMEYRWNNTLGAGRSTIYHAMSGRAPHAMLAPHGADVPQYTLPDWRRYYADHNPNVYAHMIDDETTVLPVEAIPEDGEGAGRRFDAEMRGLRTIERDIRAGNLTANGRLTMWVSKPPCSSCRGAISAFAEHYGVDITVYHLPDLTEDAGTERRLVQMTKNRILRNFHQRVANERAKATDAGCVR